MEATGPVSLSPNKFPCPSDSYDQQCDQQVADEPAAPALRGFMMRSMPPASSETNVARRTAINLSCRSTWRRANGLEKMDRVPAAVWKMPMTASADSWR